MSYKAHSSHTSSHNLGTTGKPVRAAHGEEVTPWHPSPWNRFTDDPYTNHLFGDQLASSMEHTASYEPFGHARSSAHIVESSPVSKHAEAPEFTNEADVPLCLWDGVFLEGLSRAEAKDIAEFSHVAVSAASLTMVQPRPSVDELSTLAPAIFFTDPQKEMLQELWVSGIKHKIITEVRMREVAKRSGLTLLEITGSLKLFPSELKPALNVIFPATVAMVCRSMTGYTRRVLHDGELKVQLFPGYGLDLLDHPYHFIPCVEFDEVIQGSHTSIEQVGYSLGYRSKYIDWWFNTNQGKLAEAERPDTSMKSCSDSNALSKRVSESRLKEAENYEQWGGGHQRDVFRARSSKETYHAFIRSLRDAKDCKSPLWIGLVSKSVANARTESCATYWDEIVRTGGFVQNIEQDEKVALTEVKILTILEKRSMIHFIKWTYFFNENKNTVYAWLNWASRHPHHYPDHPFWTWRAFRFGGHINVKTLGHEIYLNEDYITWWGNLNRSQLQRQSTTDQTSLRAPAVTICASPEPPAASSFHPLRPEAPAFTPGASSGQVNGREPIAYESSIGHKHFKLRK